MVTDWLHLHGLIEGRNDSANWAKGEATATSHLFTSLDREQKGVLSTKQKEEGEEKKGFLKKYSSCKETDCEATKKGRVGRDARGWGRTKQKLQSKGKGATREKGASRGKYRSREYKLKMYVACCAWLNN